MSIRIKHQPNAQRIMDEQSFSMSCALAEAIRREAQHRAFVLLADNALRSINLDSQEN